MRDAYQDVGAMKWDTAKSWSMSARICDSNPYSITNFYWNIVLVLILILSVIHSCWSSLPIWRRNSLFAGNGISHPITDTPSTSVEEIDHESEEEEENEDEDSEKEKGE